MIFLLTYPAIFFVVVMAYYWSDRFSSWVILQASSARAYRRFNAINKGFLICFCVAAIIISCQEVYIYNTSKTGLGEVLVPAVISGCIAVLIILFGRYLRSKPVRIAQRHSFDGMRFLIILFWSGVECLLALLCLGICLLCIVFGFGRFDGVL